MNVINEYSIPSTSDQTWKVLSSRSFIADLVDKLSPVAIKLPDSFYEGKMYNDVLQTKGKEYDYSAKMRIDKFNNEILIDIFTDSVDGRIKLKIQNTYSDNCVVTSEIDVDASGPLSLFVESERRNIEVKSNEAIDLLRSKL